MTQHVALYLRTSTHRQDLRSQEPDLERWVAVHAPETTVRWYRDKASGTTMVRPAWTKLEAELRAGKVSAIVVWRLDRLGRTASGLTALFEQLRASTVPLISVTEGFDLRTPAGNLLATVLASVAQYETEVRKERQAAGIAAARAQGKTWGGRAKGQRWKVQPETINAIADMRTRGTSIAAIARVVKLTRGTIYDVLRTLPGPQPPPA